MKREPAPLRPFYKGPCDKCGNESMRFRWCNGRIEMSVYRETCPESNYDHMHLNCPACGYHTVCAPLGGK